MSNKNGFDNPFDILSKLDLGQSKEEQKADMPVESEDNKKLEGRKQQIIRVQLQKKKRNGKPVSVITGFNEYREDMKEIAKMLKVKLGVGGSHTDDEIVIQGQNRDKIVELLKSIGFRNVKKSGG